VARLCREVEEAPMACDFWRNGVDLILEMKMEIEES
jgi:hypothetical protein